MPVGLVDAQVALFITSSKLSPQSITIIVNSNFKRANKTEPFLSKFQGASQQFKRLYFTVFAKDYPIQIWPNENNWESCFHFLETYSREI